MGTTVTSGDGDHGRPPPRLLTWIAASVGVALGSFALASFIGFIIYIRASGEIFRTAAGDFIVFFFVFVSWVLGLIWCAMIVLAFPRFGLRGLWLLASAPLIVFGPMLITLSLIG